jgi:hypothetical protein
VKEKTVPLDELSDKLLRIQRLTMRVINSDEELQRIEHSLAEIKQHLIYQRITQAEQLIDQILNRLDPPAGPRRTANPEAA